MFRQWFVVMNMIILYVVHRHNIFQTKRFGSLICYRRQVIRGLQYMRERLSFTQLSIRVVMFHCECIQLHSYELGIFAGRFKLLKANLL